MKPAFIQRYYLCLSRLRVVFNLNVPRRNCCRISICVSKICIFINNSNNKKYISKMLIHTVVWKNIYWVKNLWKSKWDWERKTPELFPLKRITQLYGNRYQTSFGNISTFEAVTDPEGLHWIHHCEARTWFQLNPKRLIFNITISPRRMSCKGNRLVWVAQCFLLNKKVDNTHDFFLTHECTHVLTTK